MKTLFLLLIVCAPFSYWSSGIKIVSKYPIDAKLTVRVDEHMQGIWKLEEDTDSHNYFIVEKDSNYAFCTTYMNRSGDNRGLEHGGVTFFELNHVKFMTLYNWDDNYRGYVFFRIRDVSQGSWYVTAALVADPAIAQVKSSDELLALLVKDLNDPSAYGKDLHFRKKFEFNTCH